MRRFNLRFWFWRLMPFIFCLGLILCHLVPFHFLPQYPYPIQWVLIPIFYFAVYCPKCLSAWAVFILGLTEELLIQSPLGVTSFCFVFLFFVANLLRRYLLEMTFIPLWIIFAALLLMVEILNYLLVALLSEYPIAFYPVSIEFWILVLVYPFAMRFCGWLDKKDREVAL